MEENIRRQSDRDTYIDGCVVLLVEVVSHSQTNPILAIGGFKFEQGLSGLYVSGIFSQLDLQIYVSQQILLWHEGE